MTDREQKRKILERLFSEARDSILPAIPVIDQALSDLTELEKLGKVPAREVTLDMLEEWCWEAEKMSECFHRPHNFPCKTCSNGIARHIYNALAKLNLPEKEK